MPLAKYPGNQNSDLRHGPWDAVSFGNTRQAGWTLQSWGLMRTDRGTSRTETVWLPIPHLFSQVPLHLPGGMGWAGTVSSLIPTRPSMGARILRCTQRPPTSCHGSDFPELSGNEATHFSLDLLRSHVSCLFITRAMPGGLVRWGRAGPASGIRLGAWALPSSLEAKTFPPLYSHSARNY